MKGIISGYQAAAGQACIQFSYGEYQVSIAMDDSCKQACPTKFTRVYLKVYKGVNYCDDATREIFGVDEVEHPSIPDVLTALELLKEKE